MHAFDFPQTVEPILIVDHGDGAFSSTIDATVAAILTTALLHALTDWRVVNVAYLGHAETFDFVVASLATIGVDQGHVKSC